jgi:hypothetical protein
MMVRRLLIVLVAIAFSLAFASPGISAMDEVKGTVTKVEGTSVTIKDSMGAEKTVEPKNPEALKDLKVGDKVAFEDGILTMEGGMGTMSPAPTPPAEKKY